MWPILWCKSFFPAPQFCLLIGCRSKPLSAWLRVQQIHLSLLNYVSVTTRAHINAMVRLMASEMKDEQKTSTCYEHGFCEHVRNWLWNVKNHVEVAKRIQCTIALGWGCSFPHFCKQIQYQFYLIFHSGIACYQKTVDIPSVGSYTI